MTHLTILRFSTIVLSRKLIYPWSDRMMKMSRGKGKLWGEFFKYLSKDAGPGFFSISPEIRSRAMSKGLIIDMTDKGA